ncbi:MAG: 16S rRNA (guanine(966)-N(2))-methyltransferase RsmD [bacterium]
MRIISGSKKGLKLASVKNSPIRPTTDRFREVIFNVIDNRFRNKPVLDIFAGSGSLGIEALSRGAARAIFIENNSRALSIIKKNLTLSNFEERAEIVKVSAIRALKKLTSSNEKFYLIFADPPYAETILQQTIHIVDKNELLAEEGWLIVEHASKLNLNTQIGSFILKVRKRQGESEVSFYRYA